MLQTVRQSCGTAPPSSAKKAPDSAMLAYPLLKAPATLLSTCPSVTLGLFFFLISLKKTVLPSVTLESFHLRGSAWDSLTRWADDSPHMEPALTTQVPVVTVAVLE